MSVNRIAFSDFDIEDFYLFALHAHVPSYKMAFLLNKYLEFQLHKSDVDFLAYSRKGLEASYCKYVYRDTVQSITYTLIDNSGIVTEVSEQKVGLFDEVAPIPKLQKLIPEFKNVDFFLKIETDYKGFNSKLLVSKIMDIKPVIASYEVDIDKIKDKTNLIFE